MLGMWGDWIAEDFSLPFCGIQCNPRVSRNQSNEFGYNLMKLYDKSLMIHLYISFEGWFLHSVSFQVNVEYYDVHIAWVVSLASGAH